MGVNLLRHEPVNDGDDGDASKERPDGGPGAGGFLAEGVGKLRNAFRQDLHKGDIQHHAGRKPQCSGHKSRPRLAPSHRQSAANRGR